MDRRWPIQAALSALVIVSAVPLTVVFWLTLQADQQLYTELAYTRSQSVARGVAADLEEAIASQRAIAERLAQRPLIRAVDPTRCDPFLAELLRFNPTLANLNVINLQGQVICSAVEQPAGAFTQVRDRDYFRRAIITGVFTISEPLFGRISRRWLVELVQPLRDEQLEIVGLLALSIDLVRYQNRLDNYALPPDYLVTVMDRTGRVVARSQNAARWVAQRVDSAPVFQAVQASARAEGQLQAVSEAGDDLLYAYAITPSTGWWVLAGIPVETALAPARSVFARNSVLGLAALLAGLTIAALVGSRIARPLRELARLAQVVAQGDLSVRAHASGPAEVAQLANELNHTLDVRQQQQAQIQAILDASLDAITLTNAEGVLLACNNALLRRWQRTAADLLGRSASEVFPPEVFTDRLSRVRRVLATGLTNHFIEESDGAWFENLIAPVREADGCIRTAAVFSRDITAQTVAEQKLRRSNERLRNLQAIGRAILAAQSPSEIASVALRRLSQLIPCRQASITLFDDERGDAYVFAAATAEAVAVPVGARIPRAAFGAALFEQMQRAGWLVIDDALALTDPPSIIARLSAAGVRSILASALMVEGQLIGYLAVLATDPKAFNADQTAIVEEVAAQLAVALHNAQLLENVQAQSQRLRGLANELARAQEVERRALARELHDSLGQNLTALNLNLSLLRAQPAGAEGALDRLADSIKLVETTVAQVRNITALLHPPMLEDYGLFATLRWHSQQVARRTGLRIQVDGAEIKLPPAIALALFRIAQEALSNVVRHAHASAVTLTLKSETGRVRLTIADDGQGFAPSAAGGPRLEGGWGLLTMQERARAIGGQFHLESAPDAGVHLTVEAPLTEEAEPAA